MDPEKKRQLSELRKDRRKVIGELRKQLNSLEASTNLNTLLAGIVRLLHALVSLQETGLLLKQWREFERKEKENAKQKAA